MARKSAGVDRRSSGEAMLELQIRALKLPLGWVQYAPIPGRRYRIDRAWPEQKLGIEVEGGVHTIRAQWEHDCRRNNDMLLAGWRIFRLTSTMIKTGESIPLLERLLK